MIMAYHWSTVGGGGASAAISLDHFFYTLKQYYLALSKGGGVNATPTGCVITPQELQGLNDVLTLIRIITTHVSLTSSIHSIE